MDSQEPHHSAEEGRKATVWSGQVSLEIAEDDTAASISLTEAGRRITLHLTLAQWVEIRRTWCANR